MKQLIKNRLFAAACLVVVIIASVFLGGFRSVKRLENKAYNAYFNDFVEYGDAGEDMKKMSRYASMLASVCNSCGCISPSFSDLADQFDKSVGEPYIDGKLYDSLFNEATVSYNLLINHPDAEVQQKISAKQYYYEIDAIMRRLENNEGYNESAKKYNHALQAFPVSLLLKKASRMIVFD